MTTYDVYYETLHGEVSPWTGLSSLRRARLLARFASLVHGGAVVYVSQIPPGSTVAGYKWGREVEISA